MQPLSFQLKKILHFENFTKKSCAKFLDDLKKFLWRQARFFEKKNYM